MENKKIKYYVAIGSHKNHSGLECEIYGELQIGDFVELYHEDNEDEDDGEMVVITSRCYSTIQNEFFFYAERVL